METPSPAPTALRCSPSRPMRRRSATRWSDCASRSTMPIGSPRIATAASPRTSIAPSPRPASSASQSPRNMAAAGSASPRPPILMQAVAQSGAGLSGASALHMNIFGLNPVVRFGTAEQKRRMLPPLVAGRDKACFAVTEPDAGLDTLEPLDPRGARRRPLPRHRPQNLDFHRPGRDQDAAARPHDAARGREEAHRGALAVLHRSRPPPRRGPRDREDGPQGGQLQHAVHRRPAGAASPIASARRAAGSNTFSTA